MKPSWMILIFAIFLSTAFANANEVCLTDFELSLQQILENRTHCVKEIIGDKIYLNTDSISISEKGICVVLNELGDWSFVPVLCTDAAGCFINVSFTPASDYRMGDWADSHKKTCPGCGTLYHTSCPNKDCPLKKKK